MKLEFDTKIIKAVLKAGCKNPSLKGFADTWRDVTVDSARLMPKDLQLIRKVLLEKFADDREAVALRRQVDAIISIDEQGVEAVKVRSLKALADVIEAAITKHAARRWIFIPSRSYGDWIMPYVFVDAEYHERDYRTDYPAHVKVDVEAIRRGQRQRKGIEFRAGSLVKAKNVFEVLERKDIVLATPELVQDYDADVERYNSIARLTGAQFLATGTARKDEDHDGGDDDDDRDRYWWRRESSNSVAMTVEDSPTRVIMDDVPGHGKDSIETDIMVGDDDVDDSGDADEGQLVTLKRPIHPIVRVFSLRSHQFVTCHIADLEAYRYDRKLGDKLILPASHRQLIDVLTDKVSKQYGDIIAGKATGVIVLASGPPGTGKTLTAEVYSEVIERPLYMVQCSQLGTDEDTLEKRLGVVLRRSVRWGAILLIDESDVYIHERGADIHQNAVVGVLLRLLEYFRGVMFLTTNRATVVDDAILSRVTAHIRYGVPEAEDRERVWKVLSEVYGIEWTKKALVEVIKTFPNVSGRTVRALLRLSKMIAEYDSKPVTVKTLLHAAKFHDFADEEKDGLPDVQRK